MFNPYRPAGDCRALGGVTEWLMRPFAAQAVLVLRSPAALDRLFSSSWIYRHSLLAAIDHQTDFEAVAGEIADDFARMRFGRFVAKWCGRNPPGLKSLFTVLAEQSATGPGDYIALFDLLSDGGEGARDLCADQNTDFARIKQRAALPSWLRGWRAPGPLETSELLAVGLGRLAQEAVADGRRTRCQLAESIPTRHHAIEAIYDWAGVRATFPEPRWRGTDRLRFLPDAETVRAASRQFRNCARRLTEDCLSGRLAIYVWEGDQTAMVSLFFVGDHILISEIAGPMNADIDRRTLEAILDEIYSRPTGGFP